MKLVDSSGWLEFFIDGPLADSYARHLSSLEEVVTPTIVLFEVYKRIKRERSEESALIAVAAMEKTRIVPLSPGLSLAAADLSLRYKLAMADAIVYATAQEHGIVVVTSDSDFSDLPGVLYLEKPSTAT